VTGRRLVPPGERLPRRRRFWVAVSVAGALLGLALSVAALQVHRSARSGAALLEAGSQSLRSGDEVAATRHLSAADGAFSTGEAWLNRWPLRPLRSAPLLDRQIGAARALLGSGSRIARAGARVTIDADPRAVRVRDGVVDIAAIERLEAPLQVALQELRQAQSELSAARVRFVAPVLDHRLRRLRTHVAAAIDEGEVAALAARVAPSLFGSSSPRRYFLAIQTPVESRGSGGMIGNFGELVASRGRLSLERLGRTRELNLGGQRQRRLTGPEDYVARYGRFEPASTWQNVTMSPDFPSVGKVIQELYPQSGGRAVDGVIGIDPIALAALLELVGPVRVPEWPEPLTSSNAADVLLRQQYERLEGAEREEFLASTTRAVFDRLTTTSLPPPAAIIRALAPAVRGRHLTLFSTRAEEQRLFERVGAAGAMPPVQGDFVSTVVQDASGSKIDLFLKRSLRYEATYDPATGAVGAEAVVSLQNTAPPSGLPAVLIGDRAGPTRPGENRLYVSLYSPLAFTSAELDGRPLLMESEHELGRNVYSAFLLIPPGQSVTLRVALSGSLAPGSRYRLDVASQPAVEAGELDVEVRVPGRRVTAADGWLASGDVARARTDLAEDRSFHLRVAGE